MLLSSFEQQLPTSKQQKFLPRILFNCHFNLNMICQRNSLSFTHNSPYYITYSIFSDIHTGDVALWTVWYIRYDMCYSLWYMLGPDKVFLNYHCIIFIIFIIFNFADSDIMWRNFHHGYSKYQHKIPQRFEIKLPSIFDKGG